MDLSELRIILDKGEDQYTEFKSKFPEQAHKIAKEMVAFANSGGGTIFMGVDDAGKPVGIEDPLRVNERLAGIAKGCNPPIWPEIDHLMISPGINLVYAEIPHKSICTYQGKVFIRVGSTIREAGGTEIKQLNESLSPKYTRLQSDIESEYRIEKLSLRNKARLGYCISAPGILLYAAILLRIWVLMPNGVPWYWIASLFVMPAIFGYFLMPYFDEMQLYIRRPIKSQEASYIGQGRFMKNINSFEYLVYYPTAPCIYPCCKEGKIVADAPPREVSRFGRKPVGICSIAGKDHSYRLDPLLVATPEELDWRPPS